MCIYFNDLLEIWLMCHIRLAQFLLNCSKLKTAFWIYQLQISRMESKNEFHECKKSCNCGTGETLRQTLGELDFERGIWSAGNNYKFDKYLTKVIGVVEFIENYFTAQSNDLSRVNKLLSKGIPPDLEDASGYTALHYASRNGHLKVCEKLLSKGANVNATTRSGRTTPLHRAATQGHAEIVQLLLDYGANANIQEGMATRPFTGQFCRKKTT